MHLLVCWLALSYWLGCVRSADRSTPSSADIVLGLIAPFERNRPAVDGALLAVEEINTVGGILVDGEARKIKLLVEDNRSEPETAVSKALKLINRDGVVALIGLPRSFNAIPVARIAEQHGIPLVSTMSTHPETTAGKRFVFRLAFLDAFQGKALADFAFDDLGARRAAILFDVVGPYNTYLSEVFGQAFSGRGGEMVATETFTEDDLEATEQLKRIRDSGAEILFLPNSSDFVRRHVPAARAVGFAGTFLGSDSWSHGIDPTDDPEFHDSYFSDLWAPDQAGERSATFIASYRQAFGAEPTASAALSYDAVLMIARAITGDSVEPEAIKSGLAGLGSFHGVSGTITYRGSGDPKRSVFIRRFDEDGQIRLHREINP